MGRRQADIIKHLPDKEIVFHLYLTQGILLVVSLVLGFFFFDNWSLFTKLWNWKDWNILFIGSAFALVVVIVDLLLMKWLPEAMYDDGGINERIFQKRSIPHIFILCLLISFSEEILFRGVIQTHFGLFIASLIFAVLHVRYLYKWVLLTSVVLLSFLLGYIYELYQNLWITVYAHFWIDFIFAVKIRADYLRRL
ncbi:type II CAAX endopeptidase family protein [Fredinandcohnia sp. QZ13]|uniref:CPBP family intramembrane glutamic endopeptidase n=1 Tax=Fredinandcohnia sp. QZ13 TaxID=3073144 RepID=UPI0028530C94|nr:type II CAAX endopeptidase family protein [Fredinandcohnia sp. QZ13]MDR4888752.1 type II CAAX endopeptidase family protein [Fredinandcohnia sp. QZ13]